MLGNSCQLVFFFPSLVCFIRGSLQIAVADANKPPPICRRLIVAGKEESTEALTSTDVSADLNNSNLFLLIFSSICKSSMWYLYLGRYLPCSAAHTFFLMYDLHIPERCLIQDNQKKILEKGVRAVKICKIVPAYLHPNFLQNTQRLELMIANNFVFFHM